MGIIQNLKDKAKERLQKKADKAGMNASEFKHNRKEKTKETLSKIFADGERGLLTQKSDYAGPKGAEAFGQEERAKLQEDNKKAMTDSLSSMIKGPEASMDTADITNAIKGTPLSRGGGYKTSSESPIDRGGMSENASAMWRKKKGYNW